MDTMGLRATVNASIYIVRHGECMGNAAQKVLPPFEDKLTEVGKTQARLLGTTLKDIPFTRAFASDFPRTLETAQIILEQSVTTTKDVLREEKRVRERDYTGIIGLEVAPAIAVLTDSMKKGIKYLDAEMPESETVRQFEDRIISFLSEVIRDVQNSKLNEENILVVSHGLTIQRFMVLLNRRGKEMGVDNWTESIFCEKIMRNTTFHKVVLQIPRDITLPVTGHVELPHSRDHITRKGGATGDDVKDLNNYTFLDKNKSELANFEDETAHFCHPV